MCDWVQGHAPWCMHHLASIASFNAFQRSTMGVIAVRCVVMNSPTLVLPEIRFKCKRGIAAAGLMSVPQDQTRVSFCRGGRAGHGPQNRQIHYNGRCLACLLCLCVAEALRTCGMQVQQALAVSAGQRRCSLCRPDRRGAPGTATRSLLPGCASPAEEQARWFSERTVRCAAMLCYNRTSQVVLGNESG
jgi:hypothetical protein